MKTREHCLVEMFYLMFNFVNYFFILGLQGGPKKSKPLSRIIIKSY